MTATTMQVVLLAMTTVMPATTTTRPDFRLRHRHTDDSARRTRTLVAKQQERGHHRRPVRTTTTSMRCWTQCDACWRRRHPRSASSCCGRRRRWRQTHCGCRGRCGACGCAAPTAMWASGSCASMTRAHTASSSASRKRASSWRTTWGWTHSCACTAWCRRGTTPTMTTTTTTPLTSVAAVGGAPHRSLRATSDVPRSTLCWQCRASSTAFRHCCSWWCATRPTSQPPRSTGPSTRGTQLLTPITMPIVMPAVMPTATMGATLGVTMALMALATAGMTTATTTAAQRPMLTPVAVSSPPMLLHTAAVTVSVALAAPATPATARHLIEVMATRPMVTTELYQRSCRERQHQQDGGGMLQRTVLRREPSVALLPSVGSSILLPIPEMSCGWPSWCA
eukprot:m.1318472 g.1318472  ORF g.1318472 m.1318472 type:complete len:394 (+) comp24841_c0_seq35:2689-3870(+)